MIDGCGHKSVLAKELLVNEEQLILNWIPDFTTSTKVVAVLTFEGLESSNFGPLLINGLFSPAAFLFPLHFHEVCLLLPALIALRSVAIDCLISIQGSLTFRACLCLICRP